MIDTKAEIVTYKIRSDDREWAEIEQRRLRKMTGRKTSQASLFSLLRSTYTQASGEQSNPVPVEPAPVDAPTKRAHDLLQFIIDHGNEKDVEWITGNLVNFSEAIRSRKQASRKAG